MDAGCTQLRSQIVITVQEETIQERGTGLIEFVGKYRDLSRLPTPIFTEIPVRDLLNGIRLLFREELEKSGISFSLTVKPEKLLLTADRKLVDQVFIPFFTTKEEGSGIGLSLSRQIMPLHQGTIEVKSSGLKGTAVNLVF